MLRGAEERKWTQVLGKGGLTGVLCSAVKELLMGRMRGGNEVSPDPREQLEVCSLGGQGPTCFLHPDGAAMGSITGVAIHKEAGLTGEYSRTASVPTIQWQVGIPSS